MADSKPKRTDIALQNTQPHAGEGGVPLVACPPVHAEASALTGGQATSATQPRDETRRANAFEDFARKTGRESLVGEFWAFLRHNKKWWLLPIVVIVMLLGLLVFLTSGPAAPFIYTFF